MEKCFFCIGLILVAATKSISPLVTPHFQNSWRDCWALSDSSSELIPFTRDYFVNSYPLLRIKTFESGSKRGSSKEHNAQWFYYYHCKKSHKLFTWITTSESKGTVDLFRVSLHKILWFKLSVQVLKLKFMAGFFGKGCVCVGGESLTRRAKLKG